MQEVTGSSPVSPTNHQIHAHLSERDGNLVRIRRAPAAHATANDERVPTPDADPLDVVESALMALSSPRLALRKAQEVVPHAPGLYAIYGGSTEWAELRLGKPTDDRSASSAASLWDV